MHPEEYDILGINQDKIFKPEEHSESSQQIRRLAGVNSNLKEQPHQERMQTIYPSNNLSMHMKEESNILGIHLNIPTSK